MIRPPSLRKDWDAFVTCDPAILQPPERPAADATEDQLKAYREAVEAYLTKIRVARETGTWTEVVIEGQAPTKFTLGQVDRNAWRSIMDRAILPVDSPRHIGQVTLNALLFRMAIRSIAGWEKFDRHPDPSWDNWIMAPASLVTQLDEIDQSIVGELGALVFDRLRGAGPLSSKG